MAISMTGLAELSPYLASSNANSMASSSGDDHTAVRLVQTLERRQSVQGQMQLRDVAIAAQPANAIGKTDVEIPDSGETKEGGFWVR